MIYYYQHLKSVNSFLLLILVFCSLLLFPGCSEQRINDPFVARVGDSFLYSSDMYRDIDSSSLTSAQKQEYIRNWINKEILYKLAVDAGITEQEDFLRLNAESQKELAGALYLRSVIKKGVMAPDEKKLRAFYEESKHRFALEDDLFFISYAVFGDEESAVSFRNLIDEIGWEKALAKVKLQPGFKAGGINSREYRFSFFSGGILRVAESLVPGETSFVLHNETGYFAVMRLEKKLPAGEIPGFEDIRERIEENYHSVRVKELTEELLQKSYKEFKVETR